MLAAYRYRGRHRTPSTSTRTGLRAGVLAGMIAGLSPLGVSPAKAGPPGGWDAIIACESGGDPRAQNPSSSASGLFQFIDSTWRSVGGTGSAKDASVAEQYARAEILYARAGTRPWNASRACWADRTAPAPPSERSAPERRGPVLDERNADGTGRYTCTPVKLHFEACDPHNLGQVVEYPPYRASQTSPDRGAPARPAAGDTHTVVRGETLVRIAAEHGTTWRALHAANPHIADPALIFPGQRLTLP